MRLTREEEFYTNFVRQGLVIKLKVGCDKDGNLLAMENTMYWDGGAYTEYGVNVTRAGGYSSTGPYDIPNMRTDSICVYTNHPVGGAYRGFGMAELHTGVGQMMDMLAEKIGMDRIEFHLRNCVRGGDVLATGMVMHEVGLPECIEKVARALNWGEKEPPSAPNKLRGKGIALAWKAPAMPPNAGSSALVKMNSDGTVNVSVGGQEIGQGTFTAMAQIAAETLGVPYECGQGLRAHRYALQPVRMADRGQPPDLEHGQRRAQRGAGCAQEDPGYGGGSLEREARGPGHQGRLRDLL